jgi:hypothetical protein
MNHRDLAVAIVIGAVMLTTLLLVRVAVSVLDVVR